MAEAVAASDKMVAAIRRAAHGMQDFGAALVLLAVLILAVALPVRNTLARRSSSERQRCPPGRGVISLAGRRRRGARRPGLCSGSARPVPLPCPT
jgi:hypothetical protein